MTKKVGLPRFLEFILAIGGLVFVSPILLLSAVLIKVTSDGSVLFLQRRVGLNGKEFTLYKFRTMSQTSNGALVTAASDNRITKIGRILRKTKCDELPGLWNVVKGEMSFVGPRPEVPQLVDLTNPLWQEILTVRPGITDPVTLELRNEEDLLAKVDDKEKFYRTVLQPYKLNGYVKFVSQKSFGSDIKIILQTLKAVVLRNSVKSPTFEELKENHN